MWFTRKGDKGTTYTFRSKDRVSKDDSLIEALGSIDELNSLLGVCKALSREAREDPSDADHGSLAGTLEGIQEDLFIIQAELAGADKRLSSVSVERLEKIALSAESKLPPLKNFVIPGASILSANLDLARSVARRAERRVVALENSSDNFPNILSYLNRLSSALFAMARAEAHKSPFKEQPPRY